MEWRAKGGGRVEEGCGGGWVGTLDALKASSRGESLGDFMADLRGAIWARDSSQRGASKTFERVKDFRRPELSLTKKGRRCGAVEPRIRFVPSGLCDWKGVGRCSGLDHADYRVVNVKSSR